MGKPRLHRPERGVPDTDQTNTPGLANHETIKNVFLNKYSLKRETLYEKMFLFLLLPFFESCFTLSKTSNVFIF